MALQNKNDLANDLIPRLKYLAYSNIKLLEPTFENFTRLCQFRLCEQKGILMKDPIWAHYHSYEIVEEYFTNLYLKKPDYLADFEKELGIITDEIEDFETWANAGIEKEDQALLKKAEAVETFEFKPEEL